MLEDRWLRRKRLWGVRGEPGTFDDALASWCARRDLNPQPSDPKSDALSN